MRVTFKSIFRCIRRVSENQMSFWNRCGSARALRLGEGWSARRGSYWGPRGLSVFLWARCPCTSLDSTQPLSKFQCSKESDPQLRAARGAPVDVWTTRLEAESTHPEGPTPLGAGVLVRGVWGEAWVRPFISS